VGPSEAAILSGERLTPGQLVGGALVLAAVIMLQLPAGRTAPRMAGAPAWHGGSADGYTGLWQTASALFPSGSST
jgi:hypothetical protein